MQEPITSTLSHQIISNVYVAENSILQWLGISRHELSKNLFTSVSREFHGRTETEALVVG